MKIAVITLHYVTNFGSLLQTYATQKVLEKLGYEVEIIDFRPIGLSFYRAVWPQNVSFFNKIVRFPFRLMCNIIQFRMVRSFLRKYIHLSKEKYHTYDSIVANPPKADYYVSGSDQIWNTQNSNKPEDLGAYYLAFVNTHNKVAYASSFGKTEFSKKEKELIKNWLKDYSSISVREDCAAETLHELGLEGACVVDPTLLLCADEWNSFHNKQALQQRYIFVYNLNRNKIIEQTAMEIAKEKELMIVNFADTFEFIRGANNRIINTPIDFLFYLANAEYVITDSFHGTAFSINYSKQFVSVPAPRYNSRLESVLRQIGCMDRLATSVEEAKACFNCDIDFNAVQEKLSQMRGKSYEYLKEALNYE